MRVELTNGAWAELRGADTLRNRERKRVIAAGELVERDGEGNVIEHGQMTKGFAFVDQLLAELITEWSFELPIPSVSTDSLDELEPRDYDLLSEATEGAIKVLFPDFERQMVEGDDGRKVLDPDSPTSPSSV